MRILLIRLSALGDVVTASPTPHVIKQAIPDAEVVWAVEERCADAVTGHPDVDEVVVLPTSKQWRKWLTGGRLDQFLTAAGDLRRRLRRRPFDWVLDLQGLFKSALLAGLARGRRKLLPADAGERLPLLFTDIVPPRIDPRHIASMYVSLLEPLGIRAHSREALRLIFPVGDAARAAMTAWRGDRELAVGGYLAIIPGTTRPQKMWPAEYWPRLLERVHAERGLTGLILGGPAERELAAAIVGASRTPVVSAVGETSIKETGALLEAAAAAVAVDTGPMHIAVAVGCPTVSLFGSTGPRLFDDGSPYLCLHREFACWPCHRHPICRHFECLRAITPADAARAVARLLTTGTAPADAASNPPTHAAPA